MDLKIRFYLLVIVSALAIYHVKAAGQCGWPRGTCTYYKDPCPPNWERCAQYDKDCPIATNHCCCRKKPPVPPAPGKCDWPRGTCTYYKDPCPPNWDRCPQYDSDCTIDTNHCCCRQKTQSVPQLALLRTLHEGNGARRCDWPKGVCTYVHDPCPLGMRPCGNYYCPLGTNRCCCRE